MALVFKDRVRQKASPSGTGAVDLGAPVDLYVQFQYAGLGSDSFPYLIVNDSNFEVGIGTYGSPVATGTTYGRLYRNQVLSNSLYNTSLINFGGSLADVLLTNAAGLSVLVSSKPVLNTKKIIKWVNSEYQLLDPVNNATSLGASIGSSVMYYNSTTTNYEADASFKYFPGDLPEVYVDGVIQATAKAFKIPHPVKSGAYLLHGCLEGPEYGIYLRGECWAKKSAELRYPEYFQKLGENVTRMVTSDSYIPYKLVDADNGFIIKPLFPWFKPVRYSYLVIAGRTDITFNLEE